MSCPYNSKCANECYKCLSSQVSVNCSSSFLPVCPNNFNHCKPQYSTSESGSLIFNVPGQILCYWEIDLRKHAEKPGKVEFQLDTVLENYQKAFILVFNVEDKLTKFDLAYHKGVLSHINSTKFDALGNYFVIAQWSGSQKSSKFGFKWNKKGKNTKNEKKKNLILLAYTLLPSFGICLSLLWLHSYIKKKKQAESLKLGYKTMIKSEPINESFIENFFPSKYYLEEKDEICPICFDLYSIFSYKLGDEVNYLKCNHLYHSNCFEQWVLSKPTFYACPVCKSDIFDLSGNKFE